MRVYVGTSGWVYSWNYGGNFDWYMKESRLNSVELNASFYRFPFPSQVKGWSRKGGHLRWSIKVNRLITHVYKFNEKAQSTWQKFRHLFEPLNPYVDFYLFQLPPSFTSKHRDKIEAFYNFTELGKRFALEVRNESWFSEEHIKWAKDIGLTWVSIDAPEFSRDIFLTSNAIYLRVHGRNAWYSHDYRYEELLEIVEKILKVKCEAAYVYFNNDHAMLKNARTMLSLLKEAA